MMRQNSLLVQAASCLKISDDGQCVCPRGCRMPTITNRTSWRGHCSRLRLRDVYVKLFDQLHNLADPDEMVCRSKICEVDFLPPGSVPGA